MPFLTPKQQRQSTDGKASYIRIIVGKKVAHIPGHVDEARVGRRSDQGLAAASEPSSD